VRLLAFANGLDVGRIRSVVDCPDRTLAAHSVPMVHGVD
jgi:hypothetical protein